MTPKVSVIMPVYNSCEYVEAAARSVLAQDLDSFELLMVDDGSTDGSAEVCDRLASEDGRVRVFHIPNGGMCHARNLALLEARGEYVAYCDNDDEFLPGLLSENYGLAHAHEADCVRFGRRMEVQVVAGAAPQVSDAAPDRRTVVYAGELGWRYEELCFGSAGVWNGLYRRELLIEHGVRFNEDLRHGCEDKIFNLDVFDSARRICLNPSVCYLWRRRASHSSSFVPEDNYFVGFGLYLHRLSQFLERHGIRERDEALARSELLAPFREMVGVQARLSGVGRASDLEFCAKVRAVYEGYWDSSLVDRSIPQSLVLGWIMQGRMQAAATAVALWRAHLGRENSGRGGTMRDAGAVREIRLLELPADPCVFAGVVTYNPDLGELRACVESVIPQVSEVLLYDNGSDNAGEVAALVDSMPHVSLLSSNRNAGLAVALNALSQSALEAGADAVFFLDQDTVATEGLVAEELASLGGDVALVCARTRDRNAGDEYKLPQLSRVEDVPFCITAGSLLSCEALASVGGYDERLFVDLVDHEICYHLRHAGWRVVRDEGATISQTIGSKEYVFSLPRIKRGRIVLIPYYRTNHALFRKHDMGRSFAIVRDKYRKTPYAKEQLGTMVRVLLRSVMVERHSVAVLRELFSGYREGIDVARADAGNAPL